jgi:hypothetical protein
MYQRLAFFGQLVTAEWARLKESPVLVQVSESYRTLEKRGIFSVGVPDTEWPLLDYAGLGDGKYWEATKVWRPEWVKTRLDDINYHFRQDGEHRYAYDLETLRLAIEAVGFTHVKRRDFDPNLDTESASSWHVICRGRKTSLVGILLNQVGEPRKIEVEQTREHAAVQIREQRVTPLLPSPRDANLTRPQRVGERDPIPVRAAHLRMGRA